MQSITRSALMLSTALAALSVQCATRPSPTDVSEASSSGGEGGRARGPASNFPTREEITRIATTTRPTLPPPERTAPLERWELAGPFPATLGAGAVTDASPFTALLRAQTDRTGGRAVVSASMQCAAREIGRYLLRHEGSVPEPFASFVAGRCGGLNAHVGYASSRGTADPNASEATLAAEFRAELAREIAQVIDPARGPQNVGVWFGRDGDRILVALAVEPRRVALEPVPVAPDAQGQVTFQGRLLETAQRVVGQINQGEYESTACELDPAVRLPLFRMRCPVRAGDAAARVELSALPPGRFLSHTVLSAVVGAGRDESRTFEVTADDPTRTARDAQQARDVLTALVNEARQRAGVPPLDLAARESDTACQVTPVYFANALGADGAESANDRLALGMMAGWDVDGAMIREGRFITMGGVADNNLARWVAWTLERPLGRTVLLDRGLRQVALCPWMNDGQVQGVLWSSYALYDDAEVPAEVEAVYRRLDAARRARGVNPAERLTALHAMMKTEAQTFARGGRGLDATLQVMLDRAVEATQSSMRGIVIPTSELDSIEFPRAVVEDPAARVAVQLVHWRAPDAAWGQAVVFLLVR